MMLDAVLETQKLCLDGPPLLSGSSFYTLRPECVSSLENTKSSAQQGSVPTPRALSLGMLDMPAAHAPPTQLPWTPARGASRPR